jgi:hypothetical protein
MILPSLLQYSSEEIHRKLESITQNKEVFCDLTSQSDPIHLHLDFVLKRFAQSRSVLMSMSPSSVLDIIGEYMSDSKITVSIHLMGETEDLYEAYEFFDAYDFNENWTYILLVPGKFRDHWNTAFEGNNVSVGIWYDLEEWDSAEFEDDITYLLMTVYAGKSGQVSVFEDKEKSLSLAHTNPDNTFIVDGGWKLEENNSQENVLIVSHSSFWKAFETKTSK